MIWRQTVLERTLRSEQNGYYQNFAKAKSHIIRGYDLIFGMCGFVFKFPFDEYISAINLQVMNSKFLKNMFYQSLLQIIVK